MRDGTLAAIPGKFAPLHAGHLLVIDAARAECDRLLVVVYEMEGVAPPAQTRAGWIRALRPDVETLVVDDPAPSGSPEVVSRTYADHLQAHHREPITHVFTSEEYGDRFASRLGATHVSVDPDRLLVPVSGTAVRSDPFGHREFLSPVVYRTLVTKVCLWGAESTGKTTLAEALADRYETHWMPEYGRELFEERGGVLELSDFLAIAEEHLRREDELVLESRRFLFCDTNAIATEFWSQFYCGQVDPALRRFAREVQGSYLYVLCGNDIPWVQDGWRETGGGPLWHEHQRRIAADLDSRGIQYFGATGALDERVEAVASWLDSD